jgi:hypothetical protein
MKLARYVLVIPAFGRLRQEDLKFEVSLGYILRLCLKKSKNNKKLYKTKFLILSDINFMLHVLDSI